jgi:hypothetical protein
VDQKKVVDLVIKLINLNLNYKTLIFIMGNIVSMFNFICTDEYLFGRNKKKDLSKSKSKSKLNAIPMCVITPLSPDYNIQISNYEIDRTNYEIDDAIPQLISLSKKNNNIKV